MTSLRDLQNRAHRNSADKGFWDDVVHSTDLTDDLLGNKLMLIVGEVAEAHEEVRSGHRDVYFVGDTNKPEGLPVELADVIIRVLDLAGALGIDLEHEVEAKMLYNESRPYKHGKRF